MIDFHWAPCVKQLAIFLKFDYHWNARGFSLARALVLRCSLE
jgi:hypothetical protein